MQPKNYSSYYRLSSVSLVLAPLLFAASTFLWKGGEYGVAGGTILALSCVLWIAAFNLLFSKLKTQMPLYASVGFLFAIWGCVSGANFGLVAVVLEVFHISHDAYLKAAAEFPLSFNLLLFWSGPLFPLSLLILSINLLRKKFIPAWVGICIMIGALAFPVSRILRINWIAHLTDLLLAVPFVFMGIKYILNVDSATSLKEVATT